MVTERTAYVSRPAIAIDGQAVPGLAESTLSVIVTETVDGLYCCEVTVNNFGIVADERADYLYFDRKAVDFGREYRVQLGNPPTTVFGGYITALEGHYPIFGGATLTILAEDRLQALRMTRRSRTFEDMTDADIIQAIASEHGLTPQINLAGPTQRIVAQVNLSDLAFIRERARALGGELWLEDNTLHASPRDRRGTAEPIELGYGAELKTFTVMADLAHQASEVRVSGWDVNAKEAINESADESAIASELNGGSSGASILEKAFGSRIETIVHAVPLTIDEARKLAAARYQECARRFVTGNGIAEGDSRIHVGRGIHLGGLGRFDGAYYPVRVQHTYDLERGFQTEFDLERAAL